jgi:hypothetical protein
MSIFVTYPVISILIMREKLIDTYTISIGMLDIY